MAAGELAGEKIGSRATDPMNAGWKTVEREFREDAIESSTSLSTSTGLRMKRCPGVAGPPGSLTSVG